MTTIATDCQFCHKEFQAPLKEVNRGHAKFCSLRCGGLGQPKRAKLYAIVCEACGDPFLVAWKSRDKRRFCSHKCHGGSYIATGEYTARREALELLPTKCFHCDKVTTLILHHIDHNHFNNDPANWRIVCKKHHMTIEHKDNLLRFQAAGKLALAILRKAA